MSDLKIGAAYIRVSTHDQEEYSPESQVKMIHDYASKNGIIIPNEYVFRDDGISGRKADKRPEFMRMISTAKQKPAPFEVILVWKFSRFARNEEESIVYKSLLRKECKVDVVSVSEPIMDGPFGSLIERIIEWMDAFYSVRLAGEVKRGMSEKVSRGEAVSIPAFGYQMADKKYIPDPDEAPMLKKIFSDYLSGVGQREIAVRLNNLGYKTKRGNPFENRTIEYILQNPVYIGKIRWNPSGRTRRHYQDENIVISQGIHEPLISDETFEEAQRRIREVKSRFAPYARKHGINFMLQGLVKCDSCGSVISRCHDGALQCAKYAKGVCSVSHYVLIDVITKLFIDSVNYDISVRSFNVIHKTDRSDSDLKIYQAQLEKEKRKLARVKEAYAAGIDSIEEYKINKEKISLSISEIEKKKAVKSNASFDPEAFADRVSSAMKEVARPDLAEEEKNAVLRTFIDRIVFGRVEKEPVVQIFYYD